MKQRKIVSTNVASIETKPKEVYRRKYDPKSFVSTNLTCAICKEIFTSNIAVRKHLHSHMFGKTSGQKLTRWHEKLFQVKLCVDRNVGFEVRNVSKCKFKLGHVYIINQHNATLKSIDNKTLNSGESTFYGLDLVLIDPKSPNTIIVQAFKEEYEYFEHRQLGVCCGSPNGITKSIKLKPLAMCKNLMAVLSKSDVLINNHFRSKEMYRTKLDATKYKSVFTELSMIERISNQMVLDTYRSENIAVKRSHCKGSKKDLFEVVVYNVKDKMSQLSTFDIVKFRHPNYPKLLIVGSIFELLKDRIVFEKNVKSKCFDPKLVYNMTFHLNGYTYDMETSALELVETIGIVKHLFPTDVNTLLPPMKREFIWFNKDIIGNQLQMQAVRHIVAGTAYPAPYILFGPPGTGKTKTIVEAITQILLHDDKSRILVCATSNAAADELALRIIRNLPNICWNRHQMYRVYSSAYAPEVPIPEILRTSSNFDLKYCPELNFLCKFRIIVATPIVSGSFKYAKLDPSYFSHLFIDECGSATEVSTLVAISCAPRAQIILSGDPKQLGPVVMSKHASDLGLGLSMLERLIDTKVYEKLPDSNDHNPNVLIKLLFNYRSHPAIIAMSNNLFYNGDLIAKGNIKNTHCFVNWAHLPSPGTPIIFHASTKQSQRENNSTSIFNMDEIVVLLKYINLIMKEQINGKQVCQEDIGIISPYKKQCHKIVEKLEEKGLKHIMVATVEKFQGKEKPIILVSTTRCKMGGIGFLRCPKRLNVLLTRAQCLMIIIGDPHTLKTDKNWRQVLEEFKETGVCTGDPFVLTRNVKHGRKLKQPEVNKKRISKSHNVSTKKILPKVKINNSKTKKLSTASCSQSNSFSVPYSAQSSSTDKKTRTDVHTKQKVPKISGSTYNIDDSTNMLANLISQSTLSDQTEQMFSKFNDLAVNPANSIISKRR